MARYSVGRLVSTSIAMILTKVQRQPLLVSDMLQLRYHDPSRLLVDLLVTPHRVKRTEDVRYSVMLSKQDGVSHGQSWSLIYSDVP